MKTRRLGKTELQVSEIGFGGEWLERLPLESIFWTAGWQIRNQGILLEKESKRTVASGLFRDILVPPGKTNNISVQEI